MNSLYLIACLLSVLSLMNCAEGGNIDPACTTCCAAYWACTVKSIFGGGKCRDEHAYCLSRCQCYKFAL